METNITEQEELRKRFFISQYQLNALLDNIPKIIYMKDLDGNYITGTRYSKDFFNNGVDYFHQLNLDYAPCKITDNYEDKFVIDNNKLMKRSCFKLKEKPL